MLASSSLGRKAAFRPAAPPTCSRPRCPPPVLVHCCAAAVDPAAHQEDAHAGPNADWQERPAAVPEHLEASTSYADDEEEYEDAGWPVLRLAMGSPENTRVKSAKFVKSSVKTSDCPPERLPEFAVIGRSNVGKSSLINMLTNSKKLALVSKEPGKTRCINHFLINNKWYLVDLPGYGYARTGRDNRTAFDNFTKMHFLQRRALAHVMLLVDASIPPQKVDLDYASWLGQRGIPFSIVFTKADKRKKRVPGQQANTTAFKQALLEERGFAFLPPCIATSAADGQGKMQVLHHVASLRELFEQGVKQRGELPPLRS